MHESAWSNVISSWRMGWSGFLSCVEHFKFSLKTKSPLQVALNQNCRFIMGEGIFFRGKWIIFRQSRPFLSESLKGEEKNVFLLEKDIKPVKQAQSGFPGWDGWMDAAGWGRVLGGRLARSSWGAGTGTNTTVCAIRKRSAPTQSQSKDAHLLWCPSVSFPSHRSPSRKSKEEE